MKNIQIIEAAINCQYDIYSATDEEFAQLFPAGEDIAFIEDVYKNGDPAVIAKVVKDIRSRRIAKRDAIGIHGTIFYDLDDKKMYYPTRRDDEAINPDGSSLR